MFKNVNYTFQDYVMPFFWDFKCKFESFSVYVEVEGLNMILVKSLLKDFFYETLKGLNAVLCRSSSDVQNNFAEQVVEWCA